MSTYTDEERVEFMEFLIDLDVITFKELITESYKYSQIESEDRCEIDMAIDLCEIALGSDDIDDSLSKISFYIDMIFVNFSNILGYHIVKKHIKRNYELQNQITQQSEIIGDLLQLQRTREQEHKEAQEESNNRFTKQDKLIKAFFQLQLTRKREHTKEREEADNKIKALQETIDEMKQSIGQRIHTRHTNKIKADLARVLKPESDEFKKRALQHRQFELFKEQFENVTKRINAMDKLTWQKDEAVDREDALGCIQFKKKSASYSMGISQTNSKKISDELKQVARTLSDVQNHQYNKELKYLRQGC